VDKHHAQPRRCRCGVRLARDNRGMRCTPCQAAARGRLAAAPEMPASFWEEPELVAALAGRHMGRVIRAFRPHPDHGPAPIAQTTVAGWVGITQAQLSRIENGPPSVHLDRLIQWAQILRIPPHLLWFTLPEEPAASPDGDPGPPAAEGKEADVRRVDFLRLTGAAVTNVALPAVSGSGRAVSDRECAEPCTVPCKTSHVRKTCARLARC
jgi:transcriptional regulator with XRE-family HTH domain